MSTKETYRSKLAAMKKEYIEAARAEFKDGLAQLFAKHPELKSISWTQYTPHFNDGDECTFSVHNDEPEINGYSDYDEDSGEGVNLILQSKKTVGYNPEKPNPDYSPDAAKAVKAVEKFLKEFDEDYYREAFGDHAKIIATPTGVDTEEYSHD